MLKDKFLVDIVNFDPKKKIIEYNGNNFLDDVLDGKGFYHADTPEFRARLRKRALERAKTLKDIK